MAQEWYRWNNLGAANAALNYINGRPEFPLQPGRPGKQQTDIWHDAVISCEDGMYGFPRIPEPVLDYANIPPSDRSDFLDTFVYNTNGVVEEFNVSWLPERDKDGNEI